MSGVSQVSVPIIMSGWYVWRVRWNSGSLLTILRKLILRSRRVEGLLGRGLSDRVEEDVGEGGVGGGLSGKVEEEEDADGGVGGGG